MAATPPETALLEAGALAHPALAAPALLDRDRVRWAEVRVAEHALFQTFSYRYPGPIYDLRHELMVTPRDAYAGQTLTRFQVAVEPQRPLEHYQDPFGNTVIRLETPTLEGGLLRFSVLSALRLRAGAAPRYLSREQAEPYFAATRLTEASPTMRRIAKDLRATYAGPLAFAAQLNEWVYRTMRYGFGRTDTHTSAAEALDGGVGLCQDYAHIMVGMCRSVGIAARYVSGHMLGEGGSHAWLEVLLPEQNRYVAHGFDPTNRRRPGLDYLIVAVGRDYSDVPPTAGSFEAPYGGELTCTKQAGLVAVTYQSGDVVRASDQRRRER